MRGLRRVVVDWRMQKVARVFEILLWVLSVVEENVRLRRDGYELGMACDDENFDESKETRNICICNDKKQNRYTHQHCRAQPVEDAKLLPTLLEYYLAIGIGIWKGAEPHKVCCATWVGMKSFFFYKNYNFIIYMNVKATPRNCAIGYDHGSRHLA